MNMQANHVQQSAKVAVNAGPIAQGGAEASGHAELLLFWFGTAIVAAVFLACLRSAWKTGLDRAIQGAHATPAVSAYSAWWFGK